jgi:hypothetical protein
MHEMDTEFHQIPNIGSSFGSLHVLRKDKSHSTIEVTEDNSTVYCLNSDQVCARTRARTPLARCDAVQLSEILNKDNELALDVIWSLGMEIRTLTKIHRTPLLKQREKKTHHPVITTSVASGFESFYRSALNSILNQRLSGVKAPLFPNMHIQVPTRVLYINGLKGLRRNLEKYNPNEYSNPGLARVAIAVAPGPLVCAFARSFDC